MNQFLQFVKTSSRLKFSGKLFTALCFTFLFGETHSQCPHTLPFTENFATTPFGACSGTNGGWTSTSVSSGAGWYIPNTNYAGGAAPEAHAYGDQACAGCNETIRLISPSLNTTGMTSVTLSFKHELYLTNSGASGSGTITISVQSSPDNSNWTTHHTAGYTATPSLQSVVAETRVVTVNGLSTNTLYFRFNVSGVMFKVWGWLIDDVNITGVAPSPPTITNFTPTSACSASGTSVIITGTNFTGATYVSFNGTPATYTINSPTQITATLPNGATTGTISVTTSGGTGASVSSFIVNPLPANPSSPTSNSPQCVSPGVSITPSGSAPGVETWYWQKSAGGTSIANSSGTYNVTAPGASTVYIRSQNNATSCWSAGAGSISVTVNSTPATPGTISGLNSICSGSTNFYSVVSVNGATSYTWTLPNGWTGSSSTNSISATASASGGSISVTANNTCGSSSAQTLSVASSTVPSTPVEIYGSDIVCIGTSQSYLVDSVNNATSYTWILPPGWTGASTTESISAIAQSSVGTVSVTANNLCGSSPPQVLPIIRIDTIPPTLGIITGPATFCIGDTVSYSVDRVTGVLCYFW